MPMEEIMRISVSAESPNNTGWFYTDLALPASNLQIADAKQKVRWNGGKESLMLYETIECLPFPEIEDLRLDTTTIKELNYFAKRLAALSDADIVKLRGVFQYLCQEEHFADDLVSVKDLINMTYGLDDVMIASNVGSDVQLGQFVIENDLNEDITDIPDTSLYLLDKAHIGQLQRKNDGGVFVQNCYVVAGAFEMPDVYDGEHIPEEADDDAVFRIKVVMDGYDSPEEAEAIAEWLSLPTSEENADHFAKELFDAESIEDCVCLDIESAIPQMTDAAFRSMAEFDMLNKIADRYSSMSTAEQIKYKAILEAENIDTVGDALRMTEHLSEYELSAQSADAGEFYKEYLAHHLDSRFDPQWLDNVIIGNEGRILLERLGASETAYGFVSARGDSLYKLVSREPTEEKELKTQALTDEKLEVVEVLGQPALFTNGRVTEKGIPDGLYQYELRSGESLSFATVEPHVRVDHAGTIIMGEPLDFSAKGYIELDEDSSPNFSGEEMTMQEFAEEYNRVHSDSPEMGGMSL